jgi:hypothetical protein
MSPSSFLSIGPYPSSALSAGHLAMLVAIPLLALAVWLIGVFAAARQPRRPGAAGTTSLPQLSQAQEPKHAEPKHAEPERRAA